MRAKIRIDPQTALGTIDPMIYGVNVEHLERMVYDGYWAELIANRKFAGHDIDPFRSGRAHPAPWRREFRDEPPFGIVAHWHPFGNGPAVEYVHDNTVYYSGRQSQRIDLVCDDGQRHGVAQSGVEVQGGTAYQLRAVLRAEPGISGIQLALSRNCGLLEITGSDLSQSWQTFEMSLVPKASGSFDFQITATGRGRVWLGAVSLMKDAHWAAGGVRQDVAESLKQAGITTIRWPGGNFVSDYNWELGIGPSDRRPTVLNRAWGEYESHDLGTDEFLNHCEQWDVTPFVTVNAGSGTAAEAAAWVEYCNGSPDTAYGGRRAANGREAPYGVRYWSIGNEMWGNFQVGHLDAETYARRCVEFATAMRAVDPSIHLTAVGHVRNTLGRWNERVAEVVGPHVDAVAVHSYTLNPSALPTEPDPDEKYLAIVAGADSASRLLDDTIEVIDGHWSGPERAEISYDEYGVRENLRLTTPWKERYTLRDGLCLAGIIQALQERSERIRIGAMFGYCNRLGLIDTQPDAVLLTPYYHAFALMANNAGAVAVASFCDVDTFSTAGLATEPPLQGAPWLKVAASASADRDRVFLSVINRHPEAAILADITVDGPGKLQSAARRHCLGGSGPLARNEFGAPPQVWCSESELALEIDGDSARYSFPPHSLTVLELAIAADS